MKIILSLLICIMLALFPTITAQNYTASLIPDSLTQNAHVVIRERSDELEILTVNTGIDRIKQVITVLDKNGDDDAVLRAVYDKDSKLEIKEVNLYDKTGKKVKKIKLSEITDIPAYDGVALFSDNRVKIYKPNFGDYPYTVEYIYEYNRSNLIQYKNWTPIRGYNISLEHSVFTFVHSSEIEFQKKEFNLSTKSTITNKGNKIVESWKCDSYKAIEDEPFDVSLSERIPKVSLMPTTLQYDNYKGSSANWVDYGKWVNSLYAGRDELSEKEKTKVAELLKNVPDTIQKIKTLYEYMQNHSRYVGIQLGIGGYQPFTAQTVFDTGYGDCKALSNYMHSLLKFIGVKSYPALVSAGRYIESIHADFPNFSQFDHVILCVPMPKDTLWLECTSQIMPFGFLGDFTDDRNVLLITGEGGKFAHTRNYKPDENLRTCKAEFVIDSLGTANCESIEKFQGLQYDDVIELLNMNSDEQRKWLYSNSSLPSLKLNKFVIKNEKNRMPLATVEQSTISSNYSTLTGKYMILPLNKINFQRPIQKMLKERHSEVLIQRSYIDYDTLIYKIPKSYKIESIPTGKSFKSPFGEYSFSLNVKNGQIIYTRKCSINQGSYKATEYKNFHDYILSISKADNEKAMLVRLEN